MAKNTSGAKGASKNVGGKAAAVPAGFKNAESVHVLGGDGEVIRSYSEKDHGEEFVALAHEFASKDEGRKVIVADAVESDEDE